MQASEWISGFFFMETDGLAMGFCILSVREET